MNFTTLAAFSFSNYVSTAFSAIATQTLAVFNVLLYFLRGSSLVVSCCAVLNFTHSSVIGSLDSQSDLTLLKKARSVI